MPDRIFLGRVLEGGLLVLDRPKDYGRQLRALAGKPVEVIVRRHKEKRSAAQNRWLWGLALEALVTHYGYDRHERTEAKEHLHYKLVNLCFGTRWDDRLKADVPNVRSSHLDTRQFSEYMEWLVRYAATEHRIAIPMPNEVDLSHFTDDMEMT